MKPETIAIQAGRLANDPSGAIMPAIHLSTTFHRGNESGLVYSRLDNPNRRALEECLAALEGGGEGIAFSSGMAAVAAVFQCLSQGDHILMADDTYFGVRELAANILSRWNLSFSLADMTDPNAVEAAIQDNTRLLWLETPSNPMLKITDIRRLADLAHKRGVAVGVDGTWATPILQQPLSLGADYVVHSTTKYLGGHSDLTGGVVVARDGAAILAPLREVQAIGGAVPSAFDCWLLLRGIRTLSVRMQAHERNARAVAAYLAQHSAVLQVFYPGLPEHPGHEIARQQMSGFGGMLSIRVDGGEAAAARVAKATRVFTEATSLGGVESLIEHRALVEGRSSRTPRDLLRLSVGLEHIDDLLADLDQALQSPRSKRREASPRA